MQPPRIRIAVVDDNEMIRYGMTIALESFDEFELVGKASNGIEAIALCRQARPDVVLIDLIMPQVGGVDVIRQMHQEMPSIRFVALTSFDEKNLVEEALHAGASSYLIKNLSLSSLANAIRDTWHGKTVLAAEAIEAMQNRSACKQTSALHEVSLEIESQE